MRVIDVVVGIFCGTLAAMLLVHFAVHVSSDQSSVEVGRERRQAYGPSNGWQPCTFVGSEFQMNCYGCPDFGPGYFCTYGTQNQESDQTVVSLALF